MKKNYNTTFQILVFLLLFSFNSYSSMGNMILIQPNINSIGVDESLAIKKMYPNPVKDKLTIEFQIQDKGDLKIKVYDILGNEVVSKNVFVTNSGLNRIIFDLSELRAGIYILKAVKETHVVSIRIKKQ